MTEIEIGSINLLHLNKLIQMETKIISNTFKIQSIQIPSNNRIISVGDKTQFGIITELEINKHFSGGLCIKTNQGINLSLEII